MERQVGQSRAAKKARQDHFHPLRNFALYCTPTLLLILSWDSEGMSFGRPGAFDAFRVSPPERGSFPLDHDGECKQFMKAYLGCLKANKYDNGQCRLEARKYLECRMDNGLMERDDMANLGLGDVLDRSSSSTATSPQPATPTPSQSAPQAKPPREPERI